MTDEMKPLLIRMPRKMHQAVTERALIEDRTMASVVRRAIRTALEADNDD